MYRHHIGNDVYVLVEIQFFTFYFFSLCRVRGTPLRPAFMWCALNLAISSILFITICNYPMSDLIPTAAAAMSRIPLGFEVSLFCVLLIDSLHRHVQDE